MSELRLRLNGVEIKHIRVQREMVSGYPVGKPQIAAQDPVCGWFTMDDNQNLWDDKLPKFVLEYRYTGTRGWKQITTPELLAILESSGAYCRGK